MKRMGITAAVIAAMGAGVYFGSTLPGAAQLKW